MEAWELAIRDGRLKKIERRIQEHYEKHPKDFEQDYGKTRSSIKAPWRNNNKAQATANGLGCFKE